VSYHTDPRELRTAEVQPSHFAPVDTDAGTGYSAQGNMREYEQAQALREQYEWQESEEQRAREDFARSQVSLPAIALERRSGEGEATGGTRQSSAHSERRRRDRQPSNGSVLFPVHEYAPTGYPPTPSSYPLVYDRQSSHDLPPGAFRHLSSSGRVPVESLYQTHRRSEPPGSERSSRRSQANVDPRSAVTATPLPVRSEIGHCRQRGERLTSSSQVERETGAAHGSVHRSHRTSIDHGQASGGIKVYPRYSEHNSQYSSGTYSEDDEDEIQEPLEPGRHYRSRH
jgi:hypothetical protein